MVARSSNGWRRGPPLPVGVDGSQSAGEYLEQAEALGFDALLAEHRCAWAQMWEDADVVIEGDHDDVSQDQLAARFAVFHLLAAAAPVGEAAVGARGLTGQAYEGHVFWDADVFVLPALAAIRPAAARAMLEYRIRRLPAARELAKAHGLAGARFPWESAGDGRDVTPSHVRGPHGNMIPIATGAHEEHIVADVAWAAAHYAAWTGDTKFLAGTGRDLVVETARYWASRIRRDAAGRGHLDQLMGPDEYHQLVDDNAYTNVMARWNLRRGAAVLTQTKGDPEEAETWRALADCLVDGWDPERGLYEQFAGYFDLEPLLMSQIGAPPLAVDMVLGSERVAGSQLIKQADVLMLYHLLPDEVVPDSLGRIPRLLRTSDCPRQLTLARDLGRAPGPRRGARARPRAVPTGGATRHRRSHRHHRGGPPPGHDGRGLAGTGLRVPRAASGSRHPLHRPFPPRGVVGTGTLLSVPWKASQRARRTRFGHRPM